MFTTTLNTVLVTLLSVTTAFGVFMHDARAESVLHAVQPTRAHITPHGPELRPGAVIESNPHVHVDPMSMRSLINNFSYQSPSFPPREQKHQRKHLLQLYQTRGHYAFDNTNLPIIA